MSLNMETDKIKDAMAALHRPLFRITFLNLSEFMCKQANIKY